MAFKVSLMDFVVPNQNAENKFKRCVLHKPSSIDCAYLLQKNNFFKHQLFYNILIYRLVFYDKPHKQSKIKKPIKKMDVDLNRFNEIYE